MFNMYPQTTMEEFNLDWVIANIKKVTKDMNDFAVVNRITWGGLHDPGKEYPLWCIVDTPTHEGYISIKPVPVGITIDNEDYWRQVANYSALYADFQNRIVALETEVSDLVNKFARRQTLEDRFFVFLGDSYSIATGGWVDKIIPMLGLSPDQYVRCTMDEIGKFPSFWPTEVSPIEHRSWRDSIEIIHDRMTAEQIAKTTDLVVCGGYNEVAKEDITLTYNGMVDFMNYVKTAFPNAKYWLGAIGLNTSPSLAGFSVRNFLIKNVLPTYAGGAELGFTVMSGTDRILWNDTQTSDSVHPNDDTYKLIATAIANNLLGIDAKDYKSYEEYTASFTPDATLVTTMQTISFKCARLAPNGGMRVSNNVAFIELNLITPRVLSWAGGIIIGTLDISHLLPCFESISIPISMSVVLSDSSIIDCGGIMTISNEGIVTVQPRCVTGTTATTMYFTFEPTVIPYPLVLS